MTQEGGVRDIADDQLAARVDVRAPAGREVVEDTHAVPGGQQRVGKVRADEAGAAGDEEQGHGVSPRKGPWGQDQAACQRGACVMRASAPRRRAASGP